MAMIVLIASPLFQLLRCPALLYRYKSYTKRTLIENKFLSLDSRDLHETDQEIADQLGVSEGWVVETRKELIGGEKLSGEDFATQEVMREIPKDYIREHPEESNRSIAEEVPVGKDTVGSLKKELEEEDSTTEDSQ